MNEERRETSNLPLIRGQEYKFRLSTKTGSSPVGSALFFQERNKAFPKVGAGHAERISKTV
jgi:hypothetical protein